MKWTRIHLHWTGGAHRPNKIDLQHYHVLIDGDGNEHRGVPMDRTAFHTLNANTGALGVSMCAMGGAVEHPFNAGRWPLQEAQWQAAAAAVARLARKNGIRVSRETILSHAEVQSVLGIRQRNKWDVTRLPWRPEVVGAAACGDLFRELVAQKMGGTVEQSPPPARQRAVLHEGARSDLVRELQTALNLKGFPVALDGGFGPATRRAVVAFQSARNLDADGIVGPTTWAALLRKA